MKHGGKRPGSGRKPKNTVQLCLRISKETMTLLGGIKPTREYLYDKLKVFEK